MSFNSWSKKQTARALDTYTATDTRRGNRRKRPARRMHVESLENRLLLAGDIEWVSQFGSFNAAADTARAVDSDGNVYVAGTVAGTLPGHASAGASDAFVRKYDAAGNEVWTRQFGSISNDEAVGVG